MLPPGFPIFTTKPCATGSDTWRNTIGAVGLSRCKVVRLAVDDERMTSALNASNLYSVISSAEARVEWLQPARTTVRVSVAGLSHLGHHQASALPVRQTEPLCRGSLGGRSIRRLDGAEEHAPLDDGPRALPRLLVGRWRLEVMSHCRQSSAAAPALIS